MEAPAFPLSDSSAAGGGRRAPGRLSGDGMGRSSSVLKEPSDNGLSSNEDQEAATKAPCLPAVPSGALGEPAAARLPGSPRDLWQEPGVKEASGSRSHLLGETWPERALSGRGGNTEFFCVVFCFLRMKSSEQVQGEAASQCCDGGVRGARGWARMGA